MAPPTTTQNTGVLDAPTTPSGIRPKVGFVSLGCPKNLVDSEVMMGLLHHAGAELTPDAEDAEIIVVNTCSFIDSAKQESVNTILEMVQHKQQNGGNAQRIIVAGCLVERYRDEIQKNIPEVDAVVGTGELEAILAAAGLTPSGHASNNSPFNILPQGTPEATIHTHAIGMVETNNEVAQLIDRAPSAVSQHSRPLADPEHDREIAPQLRIVQSLAETGTTHGDEPLNHTGDHIAHLPIGIDPGNTSRPEGDLREQQGRFSRASWDGATAALPEYLYTDATPRILTTPRASRLHQDRRRLRPPLQLLHHPAAPRQVPLAPHVVDHRRGRKPHRPGRPRDHPHRPGHHLLRRRPRLHRRPRHAPRRPRRPPRPPLAALPLHLPQQGHDAPARDHGASTTTSPSISTSRSSTPAPASSSA